MKLQPVQKKQAEKSSCFHGYSNHWRPAVTLFILSVIIYGINFYKLQWQQPFASNAKEHIKRLGRVPKSHANTNIRYDPKPLLQKKSFRVTLLINKTILETSKQQKKAAVLRVQPIITSRLHKKMTAH